MLKALEELAMNFDQKQQEAESKSKENETLTAELDKKLSNLKVIEDELDTLKEVAQNQRRRLLDMMITLLKDLGEIGLMIGGNMASSEFKKPSIDNLENAEEDFTMARLYVSKIKGEIKVLTQKCALLDEQKLDADKLFESKVKRFRFAFEFLNLNNWSISFCYLVWLGKTAWHFLSIYISLSSSVKGIFLQNLVQVDLHLFGRLTQASIDLGRIIRRNQDKVWRQGFVFCDVIGVNKIVHFHEGRGVTFHPK